jgi:ATP-binding cassette subfamily C protein LapB
LNQKQESNWFFDAVMQRRRYYIQIILASVCVNIFALLSAFFIMVVYDRVIPNKAFETLTVLTIGMSIVILFDFVMKTIRGSLTDLAGSEIDMEISEKLFDQVSRNEKFLESRSTGDVASTIKNLDLLKEIMASASFIAFADLPFTLLFLVILYSIGGSMAAIPAVIVLTVIFVGLAIQPIIKRSSFRSQSEEQGKQSVLIEILTGVETLKSVRGLNFFKQRWMDSVNRQSQIRKRIGFWNQLSANFAQISQQASQVGVVVYGVVLIHQSNLTMGSLIACVILSGRTLAPLGLISNLLGKVSHAFVAYRNLSELFREEPSEKSRANAVRHETISGNIVLKDVVMNYQSSQRPSLQIDNLIIQQGEKVAILGKIGSGKTTLLKLLSNLHTQTHGSIKIGGSELSHLHPDDIRRHIGVVLQSPLIFSGTLKDNLLLGNPDSSDEKMIEFGKLTGVDGIASGLPKGYDTLLTERGLTLSGGQRQMICIARAMISDPTLFMMDEPTSAMDTQTENTLLGKLKPWLSDRTLIVATHRGSLLKIVDRVIVMENGKIIADGPRDKIIKNVSRESN